MFRPILRTQQQRRRAVLVAASTAAVAASVATRRERQARLVQLIEAKEVLSREQLREIQETMVRTGLMGTSLPGAKSVKEELSVIRKWHQDHGFRGGIVLRELTKPLFRLYDMTEEDETAEEDAQDAPDFEVTDVLRLARHECYYLYYELESNGQLRQQIFCRGTTLSVDVLTCLQAWWVYDEDLDCRVHCGFANHANRMLEDIMPLLQKNNSRATIEISGHSLGGAVALLLALKLRKRGYRNVIKVRAIASPPFCNAQAAATLTPLLPKDTLRIEDEDDVVPLLPPFGTHVGSKMWLTAGGARFVDCNKCNDWTDSVWFNFRLFPTTKSHRIYSHVNQIQRMLDQDESS